MSNYFVNMEAESPSSTRIASLEIQPISPRTAATAFATGEGDLATVLGVAQSLVETVRRRESDHAAQRQRFLQEKRLQDALLQQQGVRLQELEARIQEHAPTEECPEGFVLNRDYTVLIVIRLGVKGGLRVRFF